MWTPENLIIIAGATLAALTILSLVWAWSWKGWLDMKRAHAAGDCTVGAAREQAAMPLVGNRIELADLRERVRKLEAIAAGVEL